MQLTGRLLPLIVVGAFGVGCSSDDAPDAAAPLVSVGVDERADDVGPVEVGPTTIAPALARTVSVSVSSDDLGIDAEIESSALADGDPFGDFATCSGLRNTVSSYSVGVGVADGPVRWVSINSAARVVGSGVIDADVRIERAVGEPVDAVGTMTLDPGLTSGTFVAFDGEGRLIEGSFACTGGGVTPATLGVDETGVVDVVALIRDGRADRVVGLASVDPAAVSCPAARDGAALIVRVDGDPSIGGITTFELATTSDDGYVLRLRVGGVAYEYDDAEVELVDDASGSFSAADGSTSIAGAFTCT